MMQGSAQTIERAINEIPSPRLSPRAYIPQDTVTMDEKQATVENLHQASEENPESLSLGHTLAQIVAPHLMRSHLERFPPNLTCPRCHYKKGDIIPDTAEGGSTLNPWEQEIQTLRKQVDTLKKDILKFQRLLRPNDKSAVNVKTKEVNVHNFTGEEFRVDWSGQLDEHGRIFGKGTIRSSDGNSYYSDMWESKEHKITGKVYLQTGYGSKTDTLEYLDGGIFRGKISPGYGSERLMHRYKGKYVPFDGPEVEGEWSAKEILVREIKKSDKFKQPSKSPDKPAKK